MKPRALPVASALFVALGGVYLAGSLGLPMGTASQPGAGLYPLVLGAALVSLSLVLLLQSLREKGVEHEAFPKGGDLRRVVEVAAVVFFFIFFLKPLGYVICSGTLRGCK